MKISLAAIAAPILALSMRPPKPIITEWIACASRMLSKHSSGRGGDFGVPRRARGCLRSGAGGRTHRRGGGERASHGDCSDGCP